MKKRVLVAVIAAAMPLLAKADVTIYGSIRGGIDSLEYNGKTTTGVDDYNSRIGFKGSEDLGNGLKAVWQLENGFTVNGAGGTGSASGTLANRTSFVGLQGSFGKLTVGNQLDIMSETEASDNLYGPRRDTLGIPFPLFEASDIFGAFGDGFAKNAIRYDTPGDLHGFSAVAEYGAGEAISSTTGKQTGNNYGLRLAYTNSGFFGAFANMTQLNALGSDKNSTVNRFEFGYDANNLYLAGTYEKNSLYGNAWASGAVSNIATFGIADTGLNKLTSTAWALNAAYTFGAFKPSIIYSKRSSVKVDGMDQDWGASQWAAAVDYTLSKSTMLEAGYGQIKENQGAASALGLSDAKSTLTWLMMKHNF